MKKTFFQKLKGIFQSLGLSDKVKAKQMTSEDWGKVEQEYNKQNSGANFNDDLAAALQEEKESSQRLVEQQGQILNIYNSLFSASAAATEGSDPNTPPATKPEDNPANPAPSASAGGGNPTPAPATPVDPVAIVQNMANIINSMAGRANTDKPEDVARPDFNINGPGTNQTHFLGISHPMFSLDRRWNKIAADPSYAIQYPTATNEETESFIKETRQYGLGLAQRFNELKSKNMLDAKRLMAFTNDFSSITDSKLGDYYLIRRQDALIARLITMYNVYNNFPRRYGVQDKEIMFSAFFDTVSQAWQEGEVFKGAMNLQPEVAYVDDAMIKLRFRPMKEMERMYIGYLNTDGSDPMKWSLIEWQILNVMTQAISEQNHRRIMGIYVHPEDGVPGHYLHSSTGIVYTLIRYAHEMKLKIHDDVAFIGYTQATFLDTVMDLLRQVKADMVKDHTLPFSKLSVYLNENHQLWWKENYRSMFGEYNDFTGTDSILSKVPDIGTPIVWVPNLGNTPLVFLQEPGNLQCIEFQPGEMFALQFERRMELYLAWSVWKEGASASFAGQQFANRELLDANKFKRQRIFMNKPATPLNDGDTTIDGEKGFWFVTSANTAATALADIINPEAGVAYILEIGDENNPTSIAQAGKFSELTAAFNPVKKGDYIMLVANSDQTKYLELERMVNGVRTINATLQPNVPGVRL